MLERWVPGIRLARSYRRSWLRADLVAGVVLAAILVPQGMAYAELAGLPAVTGLYTTIACLVGYALFGPSRVLVLGPDSSVSPLIFAAITPLLVAGDPATAIALAGHAGDARRADRDRARARQARVRRRPAVEGGAGRLHERPRRSRSSSGSCRSCSGSRPTPTRSSSEVRAFVDGLDETHTDDARRRASRCSRVLLVLPRITKRLPAVLVGGRRRHRRLGRARPRGPRRRDGRHPAAGRARRPTLPWTNVERRRPAAASPRSASRWCR